MRRNTAEEREVRLSKSGDKKGISFIAVARTAENAAEFGKYLKHLYTAGVSNAEVEVADKHIYFTSNVPYKRRGRVCHHIQLKARELHVTHPAWISVAANNFRAYKKLPRLVIFRKGDTLERTDTEASNAIKDKVMARIKGEGRVEKPKRAYHRRHKVAKKHAVKAVHAPKKVSLLKRIVRALFK